MTVSPPFEPPPVPRRFSWKMRLFLSVLVFDIVFRSMMVLLPCAEWAESELDMDNLPWRLPTRAEMDHLAVQGGPHPAPVADRILESLDSVWEFAKPWPSARTRARIDSWPKAGMFAACWLNSRLEFVENVLGINEDWPMFSPNVSKRRTLARSKLLFADGSLQTIRLTADPANLTRYSHWFQEKVLDYELKVDHSRDERVGYCNYLAHRHPRNAAGSPLLAIYVYTLIYYYPRPDMDPAAYLASQNGPPLDQVRVPFYVYDVATRQGRDFEDCQEALLISSGLAPDAFVNFALSGDLLKHLFQLDK